ncbi:hypothetical protein LJE86_03650 [bacterium BMS3Abin03]|nr:hypothetical protein [bacterium BMS3Abin03]
MLVSHLFGQRAWCKAFSLSHHSSSYNLVRQKAEVRKDFEIEEFET